MPARGHHVEGKPYKAALAYLESKRDGDGLTVGDVATRYGVSKGAVSRAVKLIRESRAA